MPYHNAAREHGATAVGNTHKYLVKIGHVVPGICWWTDICACRHTETHIPDMELGHWVTGSFGSSFTSGSPGHHFDPVWDPSFPGFRKKAEDKDIKIYIFVKIRPPVIEILTFNKLSSKFYFPEACKRQTAIKTSGPLLWLQTFVCNISPHLEFIIEQGHRVNWVSESLDSRVTGSLGHKMWPSSMSDTYRHAQHSTPLAAFGPE